MSSNEPYMKITRKSLPTRLQEAGIEYTTVHDKAQGGRLLYVIDGEQMTHGEVEQKFPNV